MPPTLPESVQEIADVIGREAALRLIAAAPKYVAGVPGKRSTRVKLYVPKRLKPDHWFYSVLSADEAEKLVYVFGGEDLRPASLSGNVGGRPAKNPHTDTVQCGIDNLATIPHGAMKMPIQSRGVSAYV